VLPWAILIRTFGALNAQYNYHLVCPEGAKVCSLGLQPQVNKIKIVKPQRGDRFFLSPLRGLRMRITLPGAKAPGYML